MLSENMKENIKFFLEGLIVVLIIAAVAINIERKEKERAAAWEESQSAAFNKIDAKLDGIDAKLDGLESELSSLKNELTALDTTVQRAALFSPTKLLYGTP
jgi:hypothetical protein